MNSELLKTDKLKTSKLMQSIHI